MIRNGQVFGSAIMSALLLAADKGGESGGKMVVENASAKMTDAEFISANQKRFDELRTRMDAGEKIPHDSEDGQFLHAFANAKNREAGKRESENYAKGKKFALRFRGEVRAKSSIAVNMLIAMAKNITIAKDDRKAVNANYNHTVKVITSTITKQMILDAAAEAVEQIEELTAIANTREAAIVGDILQIRGTKNGKFASALDRLESLAG